MLCTVVLCNLSWTYIDMEMTTVQYLYKLRQTQCRLNVKTHTGHAALIDNQHLKHRQ